jgi:RNA polymerase sigma-70 factor (ECF subfamily)
MQDLLARIDSRKASARGQLPQSKQVPQSTPMPQSKLAIPAASLAAGVDTKLEFAMTIEESDSQLVERVQRGDKRAFDMLVVKYQHKVLKLIGRLISNPAEAEDVAQDAFIKAYRALKSFRGDSAFYTWLYRIAINTAKNALVSKGRRPHDFNLDLQDPEQYEMQARLQEGDTPEGLLLTEEIRSTVQNAMRDLPDDLRTAITLRELDGLSYEEIAEAMACPVGTVRSRIFRAREAIDKKLQPLLD